jgi:enoyl-[acyl-carrier protein] reductase I
VSVPGQLDAVFETIRNQWGRLDFLLHAIASARKEDLHGRLTDCSAEGFAESMLISCHSFIRMAKLAEPLMDKGGSLMTLSYYGAEKVVDHYNVMGPVKAALEASVRYLAHELGPKDIRVNTISAGAVKTRAASGIEHFDELLNESMRKAPLRRTKMPARSGALPSYSPATTRPRSPAKSCMSTLAFISKAWCSTKEFAEETEP